MNTNHTELLKKLWNSPDLTFIAKFSRYKEIEGFFNHFINPITKSKIEYPKIEGVAVEKLQVSFYLPFAEKFNNEEYYKVKLNYTDKPKGKYNPFNLEMIEISPLKQSKIKAFLQSIPIQNNEITESKETDLYYGQYQKRNEKFSVFTNIMFADTGNIYINDGEVKDVYISPKNELIEGEYYAFQIFKVNDKTKLDSVIISTIKLLDKNPYKEVVAKRFGLHNNPASNQANAKTMREIGIGMYSSKERMIYELLQNADDAPGKGKVEFHIDYKEDYLFVMHDGAPFNKMDVKAITSAGESTKEKSKGKTGYKGIGFKSVFTNSTEVWIKSRGYRFAFMINSEIFKDFDSLYFPKERRKQFTSEGLIEEQGKFSEYKQYFDYKIHVPWQLMPIWQEELPKEFNNANFTRFNNNVQIALRIGKNNINDYLLEIENITSRPHFLLFLRNTTKFNSPRNGVMITKNDTNKFIEITKFKGEINEKYYYIKKTFEDIEVTNEEFNKYELGIIKKTEYNENAKSEKNYFVDLDNNVLPEIPQKLASVNQTEISFAINVINNKISCENGYLTDSKNYTSLFTYLPMEDQKLILPFLVNADFVPDSRRENLQYGTPWNRYLMIKVAEKHISMICDFANHFTKDELMFESYLSLLLKTLIPVQNIADSIIQSYNDTYLKELESAEIIVNSEGATQTINETILDSTDLANLFGADTFYTIFGADKKLPHQNLDTKYLFAYQYLKIEQVSWKKIIDTFNEDHCTLLGEVILKNKLYNDPKLLKWLDKLALESETNFNRTPFIYYNQKVYSINDLMEEDEVWIINKNTSDYEDLLKNIGFKTINLKFNEYTNINNQLNAITGYINDKAQAYERIANHNGIAKLNIQDKIKLIEFFQNSSFMQGIGETKYFRSLHLFLDEAGNAQPLYDLIYQDEAINLISLAKHKISSTEFEELTNELRKQLISKENIFTDFILNLTLFKEWTKSFDSSTINQYVSDLKTIYSWKSENIEILPSKWANIPWLFVNDDERFIETKKVYWSKAFNKITESKYNVIREIIESNSDYILPTYIQYELIDIFNLNLKTELEFEWDILNNLDLEDTNTLLDWMVLDGNYGDFFSQYFIEKNEGFFVIHSNNNQIIYDGSESLIKNYITSRESLSDKYTELPLDLRSNDRAKLGVLFGEQIILSIIENESYDQNIVKLVGPTFSAENFSKLIRNLKEFKLHSSEDYAAESAEHIIINRLLKHIEDVDDIPTDLLTIIESLRNNMIIDDKPLSNFDLSNRVIFGKGDDRKILQLSEILNNLQGDSDVLDNLIENFTSISHKGNLRKVFFKTRQMLKDEIYKMIEDSSNKYYTVDQVLFQILDKFIGNKRNWNKPHFDDYYLRYNNNEKIIKDYKTLLDKLLENDIYKLGDFTFQNLNVNNCVDENYAIEDEKLPLWLSEWIEIDKSKRIPFIEKLGYNGSNSSIVLFRKAMIDSFDYNQDLVIRYYEEVKNKSELLCNSITWLAKYESNIITRNISIIQKINSNIKFNEKAKGLIIPIISSISNNGERRFILKYIEPKTKLYSLKSDQELAFEIFSKLGNDDLLFVDESLGSQFHHFTIENIVLKSEVNLGKLNNNSNLWNEPFYKHWEFYEDYPIFIYEGKDMPYLKKFKEHIISDYTYGISLEYEGKYFISKAVLKDILANLPKEFSNEKLESLRDWHYDTLRNEYLLEEDTFEYKEDVDRILQGRLGISKEEQKQESGNAKTHAIYYLSEVGYNVLNIKDSGSLLENIVSPEGKEIKCIVRGAKGGLLYLDHNHWDMLEDENTYLIAVYPGNKPRIFKDRLELLQEELAENILFRIPNNKLISEVNDVFDALESEAHLILVTSEKMKESLFSKIKQSNKFNSEENGAVADDNFEI